MVDQDLTENESSKHNRANQQDLTKVESEKNAISPITQAEVESIVKGFFLAWLRGDIEIIWPLTEEIHTTSEAVHGVQLSIREAVRMELANKNEFQKLVEVYAGKYPSTPKEFRAATYGLFSLIVAWRSATRIKGRFLQYAIEDKMRDLEMKMDSTNQLLRQFIEWLESEKKP